MNKDKPGWDSILLYALTISVIIAILTFCYGMYKTIDPYIESTKAHTEMVNRMGHR
jgi:uncharacterized membrane protein